MVKKIRTPIISIKNLKISFTNELKEINAVNGISFDINKKEIVGVVGESGSGKSITALSILRLLNTKKSSISGSIKYQNKDIYSLSEKEMRALRGSEISMIFQDPMSSLNPTMRCIDQVLEVLKKNLVDIKKFNVDFELNSILKKVNLDTVSNIHTKYPHELSGGQKQRVMIAIAIAGKPKLLIADEPTTALDVTIQKEIILLLKNLIKTNNISVLFITHDLSLISEIADKLIVMYKGKIVEKNSTKKIFKNPTHLYTKALLSSRPRANSQFRRLPTVEDCLNNSLKEQETFCKNYKREINNIYNKAPILTISNLTKHYYTKKGLFKKSMSFTALKNINLKLYKGETLGIVGESGCGKTTLGKTILQIEKQTSGTIYYNNLRLSTLTKKELLNQRKDIQIIFQDPDSSLNPKLTIGKALIEPMKVHKICKSNYEYISEAENLLKSVGLEKSVFHKYPHQLSGGQKQRIGIARAISLNPKIIICDESVSALDVSVQAKVLNLLNTLKEKHKLTYIFISHDLSIVKYMSDKIIVMNNGSIVEEGFSNDVYLNPKSKFTKKLISAIPKGL